MPRFRPSFLECYPPTGVPVTDPPLPLAATDALQVQALCVGLALPVGQAYRVDAQVGAAAVVGVATAQALRPDLLHINPTGAALSWPPELVGEAQLRVVDPGTGALVGLCQPLALSADPEPYTRRVRYRDTTTSTVFDYTDPATFQVVRLPLRLDRPGYLPDTRLAEPGSAPLYTRLSKTLRLETDYLSPQHTEALLLALHHPTFQVLEPETGVWESYQLIGTPTLAWPDPVALPAHTQVRATLRQLDFAVRTASFAPPGAFSADFTADFSQ